MAYNVLEASCGHTRQWVDEWQLRAEMGPEGYKPLHFFVTRFRRIPSLPPTFAPSRPYHPHSLYLPLPCVRNAPSGLVLLGDDKPFSPPYPQPAARITTSRLQHPPLHPHPITLHHHVDPQEPRPSVFFAQRFREFSRDVRIQNLFRSMATPINSTLC